MTWNAEILNVQNRPHTVLVVDDDPAVLASIRRGLRNEPFEVLTTERPEEALEWVEKREVDVVVADQSMPSMPGTELLDRILGRRPRAVRVILTGRPDCFSIGEGLTGKVQVLISKPWNARELGETLRRLIEERATTGCITDSSVRSVTGSDPKRGFGDEEDEEMPFLPSDRLGRNRESGSGSPHRGNLPIPFSGEDRQTRATPATTDATESPLTSGKRRVSFQ